MSNSLGNVTGMDEPILDEYQRQLVRLFAKHYVRRTST